MPLASISPLTIIIIIPSPSCRRRYQQPLLPPRRRPFRRSPRLHSRSRLAETPTNLRRCHGRYSKKKGGGVQRRPRDPRNRHNLHPNTRGLGGPPSDPSPLQAGGGNDGRSVLSVVGAVCRGGSLAAASSASVAKPPAFCAASQGGGLALLLI